MGTHRFHYWSIPIVLSRSVAEGLGMPPHSVIAVDDFAEPRALVAHLAALMRDEEAWGAYFQWKLQGATWSG